MNKTTVLLSQKEQDERVRLQVIEGRIESNLRKFKNLWKTILEDLAEIDIQKLWRFSHNSFQEYWEERFQKTVFINMFAEDGAKKSYNYYRAKAIEAAADVIPAGINFVPNNERQARELTGLKSAYDRQQASIIAHDLSAKPTVVHYARGAQAVNSSTDNFKVGDIVYSINIKSPHYGEIFNIQEVGVGRSGSLLMAMPLKGGKTIPFTKGELGTESPSFSTMVENDGEKMNSISLLPDRLAYCDAQLISTRDWLLKLIKAGLVVVNAEENEIDIVMANMRQLLLDAMEWTGTDQ